MQVSNLILFNFTDYDYVSLRDTMCCQTRDVIKETDFGFIFFIF